MPRKKAFNETEVLEKAKQLFWKQGYHATTMQNLVEHLGINRGSLYDTFGGKNELYEAAFKSYRAENLAYLKQRLSAFTSVKEGLKTLLLEAVRTATNDPDRKGCFVVNCTTEYLPKHDHILVELLDNKTNFQAIMEEQLRRGVENDEFSKNLNIKELATYIYTFFNGINVIGKVEKDVTVLERTIEVGLSILK